MSALPIPQRELFINGKWVQPARGKYLEVRQPSGGDRVTGGKQLLALAGLTFWSGKLISSGTAVCGCSEQAASWLICCPITRCLQVVNPATEGVIGRIPAGTQEDVEAAVAAAVAAHKNGSWVRSSGKQRAAVLRALAQKVCRAADLSHRRVFVVALRCCSHRPAGTAAVARQCLQTIAACGGVA